MRARKPTRFVLGAVIVVALGGLTPSVSGQTKYPGVDSVFPLAVKRGETTEVEVRTNGNVVSAYGALLEGDDIKGDVVLRTKTRKIPSAYAYVRVTPAKDARVGSRDLRILTREAITTLGRIYVTDLPTLREKGPPATLEKAQAIELPCVVNGRVQKAVETDWFRFEAKKGERINFEILGTRLHETIHKIGRFTPHFDAFLSIHDAEGRELAAADDHYFADPLLSFEAPKDGAYHVVVREANYKGHASYTYALVATRGPAATLTYPLAAKPGEEAEVSILGEGLPNDARARIQIDDDATVRIPELVRPRLEEGEGRELLVLPSELPIVREREALDASTNDLPDGAEKVDLPVGIAGRLGRADDVDTFSFVAKAGVSYRVEVFARRLFSPVDSEIEILDASGKVLVKGDDSRDLVRRSSRDSALLFRAPKSATYSLRIRDLHARGGESFVYHVECAVDEPDFELTFDPELAMVAPGNRTPIYVRAHRRGGFAGEIELAVENLPKGVEAVVPTIRPGMTDACVVLRVAPDAKPNGTNIRIHGKSFVTKDGVERVLRRRARPLVEIYQAQRVIGRTAGVCVTERSDIEVTTTIRRVVLKPGETKTVPVRLVRGAKYKSGSVSLWGEWKFRNSNFGNSLPPGVTVDEKKSRLGIVGSKVEGLLTLRAASTAKPITDVPTVVIGLIPIEFSVFVPFCTEPILVSVSGADGRVAAR